MEFQFNDLHYNQLPIDDAISHVCFPPIIWTHHQDLKCYSQILYGGSAENFRFWLFCIDLAGNW